MNASWPWAVYNLQVFVSELRLQNVVWCGYVNYYSEVNGRWCFHLTRGDKSITVEMPGVQEVQYTGGLQDILKYPMLVIDKKPWVWCFAIDVARVLLSTEDEVYS